MGRGRKRWEGGGGNEKKTRAKEQTKEERGRWGEEGEENKEQKDKLKRRRYQGGDEEQKDILRGRGRVKPLRYQSCFLDNAKMPAFAQKPEKPFCSAFVKRAFLTLHE